MKGCGRYRQSGADREVDRPAGETPGSRNSGLGYTANLAPRISKPWRVWGVPREPRRLRSQPAGREEALGLGGRCLPPVGLCVCEREREKECVRESAGASLKMPATCCLEFEVYGLWCMVEAL